MIRVFGQRDTVFTSNGDCVLSPLKAKVHKKDNGDYYLDLECDLSYIDFIVEGNIVVANTPTGNQAFRIGNVTKTKSKLVTKCYHVFYDSKNYLIADSYVRDKNCADALIHLNSATEPQSEFSTYSDIQTIASFRCVRKSLYQAIQTVIERWGGHLIRDNFAIGIKSEIGVDNGIIVQYKKNLKDITCQENWSSVVTKLLPVGKDGILLNSLDHSASLYVESSIQYDLPYTKTVAFSQDDINEEDFETEEEYKQALIDDLYVQATAYVEKNSLPQINYTLKANLDKLTDIGDVIEVIDERLGVHIMTNVIGFEYDCISELYSNVEFGNFNQTLSGLVGSLNSTAQSYAKESAKEAEDKILGIMGNSYVIYDGISILIVDTLPKEDATNVIKIDKTGIGFSQDGVGGTQTAKWSIDGSLKLQNKNLADFIFESGTSNGWKYEKYLGGNVRAWCQHTFQSSDVTWSAFLTSLNSGNIDINFPFTIYGAVVNATMNNAGGEIGWIANAVPADTKATVTIVRSGNSGGMSINIEVIGKWNLN